MAVLTFIKQHASTANASTYTFSSTSTGGANDIGATASDRQVIIAGCIAATATATRAIESITPGGVSAATATQYNFAIGGATVVLRSAAHTLVNALLTTATSISIVLTATTTVSNASIAVWSATHVGATFATYGTWATDSDGYISEVTATNAGMNVTVNTSGFFVAHAHARSAAGTPTYVWTSATEQHDTGIELSTSHSSADGTNTATVNCQISVSVTNGWWTGLWGAFDDQSPATATAGGETLYRKFTAFPGTLVGRRKLITSPRPVYEWRPEVRL